MKHNYSKWDSNRYACAWTEGSIDCYNRGCRCNGCYMKDILETRCEMKSAVLELVRKFGVPKEKEGLIEGANAYENRVIQAILDGCNTKIEIAESLGIATHSVQHSLGGLCKLVTASGYQFKAIRNRLPELVEYIRERKENEKNYSL